MITKQTPNTSRSRQPTLHKADGVVQTPTAAGSIIHCSVTFCRHHWFLIFFLNARQMRTQKGHGSATAPAAVN